MPRLTPLLLCYPVVGNKTDVFERNLNAPFTNEPLLLFIVIIRDDQSSLMLLKQKQQQYNKITKLNSCNSLCTLHTSSIMRGNSSKIKSSLLMVQIEKQKCPFKDVRSNEKLLNYQIADQKTTSRKQNHVRKILNCTYG